MMTTMMPITKGGAGLVRQYSAQYRPGQASVQQRKLFRPQSVLARSETSASETSKISSFVAAAASELQVRMWWKAGGGREILDGWQTKEGGRKGSGEIPEKLLLIFQLCDHHHHSEEQVGRYTVGPANALLRTHNPVGRGIFEESSLEPFKLEVNLRFICIIAFLFYKLLDCKWPFNKLGNAKLHITTNNTISSPFWLFSFVLLWAPDFWL